VHEATSVATVRDADGAIRMRATVPTEAKAIVGLWRAFNMRQADQSYAMIVS
jgi:hypothetical protein